MTKNESQSISTTSL